MPDTLGSRSSQKISGHAHIDRLHRSIVKRPAAALIEAR